MSVMKSEDAVMTGQEMLDRSSTWTLACDNALLNRLKSFSENLTKHSQELSRECDTLSKDITQLDYRLINVTNEFLMLSSTQFVENRVEEFEEFSASLSTNSSNIVIPKSKAEREAELMSKMKQAIQLGLSACNSKRQRQQQQDGPGPDQNRFKMKRPYLIGSPKFFSSKYCGLLDENRRVMSVPLGESFGDADSVSLKRNSDMQSVGTTPTVTFTMPPPPTFPIVPEERQSDQFSEGVDHASRTVVLGASGGAGGAPPSPNFSDTSSIVAGSDSLSRDHIPRSVTDDLKKIYGSYAPPPTADEDSDDDFRPNASAGRLFADDDEDDDLFGEKNLFGSPQPKNSDFFGTSNPPRLTTPVFSAPPPIHSVSEHRQSDHKAGSTVQTLVGELPTGDDTPRTSNAVNKYKSTDQEKEHGVVRNDPMPVTAPTRLKLPPGAVSIFGGLPPPVYNDEALKAAAPQTTQNTGAVSSLPANQNSQASSSYTASGSGISSTTRKNSEIISGINSQWVNANRQTSPSLASASPGIAEKNSHGHVSSGDAAGRVVRRDLKKKIPTSSLFADSSSDEDIFSSSKKLKEIVKPSVQPEKLTDNKPILFPEPAAVNKSVSFAATNTDIGGGSNKLPEPTKTVHAVKRSIFDESESDEDDIFKRRPAASTKKVSPQTNSNTSHIKHKSSSTKNAPAVAPPKKLSLFGEDSSESDTDLFGNKKKTVKAINNTKASARPAPAPIAQMEDNPDNSIGNEDDLFETPREPTVESETQKRMSSYSNDNDDNDNEASEENSYSSARKSLSSEGLFKQEAHSAVQPNKQEKKSRKSIFDDSESSEDDLFTPNSLKNKKDELNSSRGSVSVNKVTQNTGKPVNKKSLFADDSDSDADLFISKKSQLEDKSRSTSPVENVASDSIDLDNQEKISDDSTVDATKMKELVEAEESNSNESSTNSTETPVPNDCDEKTVLVTNDDSKLPKSAKPVERKISEKIKAMQNLQNKDPNLVDSEKKETSRKGIKTSVSVKNLALNLNINPMALKVGAKPPSKSSTPNTPDKDVELAVPSVTASPSTGTPVEDKVFSVPSSPEKEINESTQDTAQNCENAVSGAEDSGGNDVKENNFVDIIKARAKVQHKRRPPSRHFLKSLAIHKSQDEDESDSENNSVGNAKSSE